MQLLECVPNVSEGNNKDIIDKLSHVISSVDGVKLLNVDSGKAANRTVFTFVGFAESVVEAAFRLFELASQLISMENHKGQHPRMGVVDVCPLIPIKDITIEQAQEYAEILAQRVGSELHIPVYLYEQNARFDYRKKLEQIRQGEYEGLATKMILPEWIPDFGPSKFNSKTGACVIGARNFLLAFNINLQTKDVQIAKSIAAQIRESGGWYIAPNGEKLKSTGKFRGVKALGWYISDFDVVQVSTNITSFNQISMARVFFEVSELALQYGTKVKGSEIIGLVPYLAICNSGLDIMEKTKELEHFDDCIDAAIKGLGLDSLKECNPQKQILEFATGIM